MGNRYNRFFITLNQDRKDYNFKNFKAMGRCIIELQNNQGKVTFNVQNLKEEIVYRAFIIAKKDSVYLGVNVGNLIVNEKGKANLKWECNAYDVEGTGLTLSDFKIAAVLINKTNELIVPLVGYIEEEVSWKNSFKEYVKNDTSNVINFEEKNLELNIDKKTDEVINKKSVKSVDKKENELVNKKTDELKNEKILNYDNKKFNIQDILNKNDKVELKKDYSTIFFNNKEKKENLGSNKNINNFSNYTEQKKMGIEKMILNYDKKSMYNNDTVKKTNNLNNNNARYSDFLDNDKSNMHETFKSMAKKINKEIKELEKYTFKEDNNVNKTSQNESYKETNKELSYMFKNNAKMIPFYDNDKSTTWIRISLREMIYLSSDFWNLMNTPFVVYAFKKYNHLILGKCIKNDCIKYILGVPEIYDEADEVEAKKIGFMSFKYCDGERNNESKHGYWLMVLDIV